MKWILISVAAALLSACSKGDSSISAAIADQFDRETVNVIDLSVVGPSGWDRVCILTPYTSNVETEKVLGFKWDSDTKTSIGGSDGINVVVFLRAQEVLAFTEHPRNKGDFSGVDSRCVSRERAKFVRGAGEDGWTYLRARA
jgi:hypothetical protein